MLSTIHPAFNRFRQAAHGRGGVPDIAETKTQRKHTSNFAYWAARIRTYEIGCFLLTKYEFLIHKHV